MFKLSFFTFETGCVYCFGCNPGITNGCVLFDNLMLLVSYCLVYLGIYIVGATIAFDCATR